MLVFSSLLFAYNVYKKKKKARADTPVTDGTIVKKPA